MNISICIYLDNFNYIQIYSTKDCQKGEKASNIKKKRIGKGNLEETDYMGRQQTYPQYSLKNKSSNVKQKVAITNREHKYS